VTSQPIGLLVGVCLAAALLVAAAESASPTARAVVATEPGDGSVPPTAAGLTYLLEVDAAREAIEVWRAWRPGRAPTLDDKVAAVAHYAENDAWLPVES